MRSIFPVVCAVMALACSAHGTGSEAPSSPGNAAPRADRKSPCPEPIEGAEALVGPIVVLGELHGTTEIPAAFAGLVCQTAARKPRETVLVGLEMATSAQGEIDAYLESDGGEAAAGALLANGFWQREYQDGRSSQAILGLLDTLRRYRAAELKIVVRAIDDVTVRSMAERDASMAAALLKAIVETAPAQTFVLIGDVHSRVLSGYPWKPDAPYLPMGALLRTTHPDMIGLHVKHGGGSSWNCMSAVASECGAKEFPARAVEGRTPRIELSPGEIEKTGWSGSLYLAAVTASPPARNRR